jgi:hypothetical protein
MAKEFLEFLELNKKDGCKTRRFAVVSKSRGIQLGRISFYPAWRQYILEPDISTLWSDGCLKQVQEFLTKTNAEWRASLTHTTETQRKADENEL